jgi:hypothetical protein
MTCNVKKAPATERSKQKRSAREAEYIAPVEAHSEDEEAIDDDDDDDDDAPAQRNKRGRDAESKSSTIKKKA